MESFLSAASLRAADAAPTPSQQFPNIPLPSPGAVVVVHGLRGSAELNGEVGVVQPRGEWPEGGERVAVLLPHSRSAKRSISVRPCNLNAWEPQCIICLEGKTDDERDLLPLGCGCRGSAGYAHAECAAKSAAAQQSRLGNWRPWQICGTCKLPWTGPMKYKLAHEWCQRTEANTALDTERFAARTTLGNSLAALSKFEEAETVVRANYQSAIKLHGGEHRYTLGTCLNLGMTLEGQGKMKQARELYERLLETQTEAFGVDDKDTLGTAMQLAGTWLSEGHHAEAEERYREILSHQKRVLGAEDPAAMTCAMNLGSCVLNLGRYTEAENLLRETLALKSRKLGPEHVDSLMCAMNVASAMREGGQYEAAADAFSKNLHTKRRVLGPEHVDTCLAALNLAGTWVDGETSARYDEAEELIKESLKTLIKSLGVDHPASLAATMHHGAVLHAKKHWKSASAALRRAYTKQASVHGERHPETLESAWRYGKVLMEPATEVSDYEGAWRLLRATSRNYGDLLGWEHPRTLRALVSYAEAQISYGSSLVAELSTEDGTPPSKPEDRQRLKRAKERCREAGELITRCEQDMAEIHRENHPDLVRTRALMAYVALAAGVITRYPKPGDDKLQPPPPPPKKGEGDGKPTKVEAPAPDLSKPLGSLFDFGAEQREGYVV